MKASWLHWIGNEYENTVQFLSEARANGIVLPVSLEELSKMSWNDNIYVIHRCAYNESKGGSVFCRLPVTRLYGISQEGSDQLRLILNCKQKDPGGDFVCRHGVDYMEGGIWEIDATMQQVCDALLTKISDEGIGRLMVGCYKSEVETIKPPWPRLCEVPQEGGFRCLDADRLWRDALRVKATGAHVVSLYSQYDTVPSGLSGDLPGDMQWAEDYRALPAFETQRGKQLDLF